MIRSSARWAAGLVVVLLGVGAAAAERSERSFSYAYLTSGDSMVMSGSTRDIERARSFKAGGVPMLWFRDGGQEYIVRDADTLARLDAVWRPSRELDAAESALDRQQDGFDRKLEQLDHKLEGLAARREALADREEALADREEDATPATRSEIAKERRELQRQQQAISGEMRALQPPMNEVRSQMAAIQRQLEALAQKQIAAAAKEEADLRALLRRAVTAGTAVPAK